MNGVWTLVPSSLAVTMTLIGILLTALVIAREWERGTMEALLSTRIKPIHIVMISSVLKNQLLASMASLVAGFLPALMLSGLIFPIKSMPSVFQYLTMILPPRYYVSFIRSEFLSGTPAAIVLSDALYLFILGMLFAVLVYQKTSRRLND